MQPWPTDWSGYGLASWSQPLIASGGVLPPIASAFNGELFFNVATAGSPQLYRKATSSWELAAGGGTGSGVSTHSALTQLDFASAGHTDFASSGALLSFIATPAFNAHVASQTNPHGASMTVTESISIGSGTEDCYISRLKTGTILLASWTCIPPEIATPTDPATGTLWYDGNAPNKLKCYDGSVWQSVW